MKLRSLRVAGYNPECNVEIRRGLPQTLGARESDTAWLEQAVTAFENTLKKRTRDRVPLDWAGTQGNLANLELAFFEKTSDPAHLQQAMTHATDAKEVFLESGASQYIGMIDSIIARITARQDGAGG